MRQLADDQEQQQAADTMTARDVAWDSLTIPAGMGLAGTGYKWRQNLSHVEVFVKLPLTVAHKQVMLNGLACLKLGS